MTYDVDWRRVMDRTDSAPLSEVEGGSRSPLASMDYASGANSLSPDGSTTKMPAVTPGAWATAGGFDVATKTMERHKDEYEAEEQMKRTWGRLADFVGVHIEILQAFNAEKYLNPLQAPGASERFYVPSASEILFAQTAEPHGVSALEVRDNLATAAAQAPAAVSEYEELKAAGRLAVLESARARTAGETGDAYAMFSSRFYTPNSGLAVRRNKEEADGQSEHVAAWGAHWKCNVFVGDSLHQAGQAAPMLANKHYATAGMMYKHHTDKLGQKARGRDFKEINDSELEPGDIFVRYGGTGEASSHTEVITRRVDDKSFFATGAHGEGAYERHYIVDQEAFDKLVKELVDKHLKAIGKDPGSMTQEELESAQYELGSDLTTAAKIQYLDTSAYHFLRPKGLL